MTDKQSESFYGQMPYVPIHSVNSVVSLSWMRWSFTCSYNFNGETYASNINTSESRIKNYHLLDVNLSKELSLWGVDFKLGADFKNILNQKYEVIQYYPMPGFNWNLYLKISL